jgi:hypothetical protein
MKKRRTSEAAEPIGDTPSLEAAAEPKDIPIVAALLAASSPVAASDAPAEAAKIADPQREPPVLPRAAILGPRPISEPPSQALGPRAPAAPEVAPVRAPRPRKFALLAACVALSAGLGAIGGSLATGGLAHWLAPPPPSPAPHAAAAEDIRALKESVAQLRAATKTLADNVAGVRSAVNASATNSIAHLTKVSEALEKLERAQVERRAAAAPPAAPAASAAPAAPHEATGSLAAAETKPTKPGVVDGWVLRKAYRGAALVEGRYGIIEIEPGDHLPGVGRVEEIKRQDGRWVVVTPRGLIVGVQ